METALPEVPGAAIRPIGAASQTFFDALHEPRQRTQTQSVFADPRDIAGVRREINVGPGDRLAIVTDARMSDGPALFSKPQVPQINVLHFGFAVKSLMSMFALWAGIPAAVGLFGVVIASAQAAGWALLRLM